MPADNPTPDSGWPAAAARARLHIVTGKGGTGKTTVAAALALSLASNGRRVLLIEVEERQGIAQLFDLPPLPYEERKVAVAPGGGEVCALAIDVEAALMEYFAMFYNLGFAGRTLKRMGAVEFATTLAPGLRDVLLTGKAKECVGRLGANGLPVYDAVVVDAPPTGRVVTFLNVTVAMSDLARKGPIRNQADGVVALLHSADTMVHLVTLLQEMPVAETLETIAELREVGLPVGSIIVNAAVGAHLAGTSLAPAARGKLDTTRLRAGLAEAGIPVTEDLLAGLEAEATEHAIKVLAEAESAQLIRDAGRPVLTLPFLADGGDLGGVYELTESLTEQGVR